MLAFGAMRGAPSREAARNFVGLPGAAEPVLHSNSFTLLPDGSAFVYVARSASGTQLWIKKRSALRATPLIGTSGAAAVFASPDSKWVGFFAGGKVKKMPVSGGEPITLADQGCFGAVCDYDSESGGTWLDDGRLVFTMRAGLVAVSENGGALDSLVTSSMVGGFSAIFASALPGSRGLVFSACTYGCNKSLVMVLDLSTRKVTQVAQNALFPRYVPGGHLVYSDFAGVLKAVDFDAKSLKAGGTETMVLEHVAAAVSVAADGTLAYLDGDPVPHSSLVLVARDGTEQPVDTAWRANFSTLAISPDGKRIATSIAGDGEEQIWIKSIGGLEPTRFTFGKAQYTTPTFSADGATVMMTRFNGDTATWLSRPADGSGSEITLRAGNNWVIESTVSRDGSWLVTRNYNAGTRGIFARHVGSDTTDRSIVQNGTATFSPMLSPDSKFLLYASEQSGHTEVWVVPFPDAHGARWQVSTGGGSEPSWSADGKSIYYVNPERRLQGVDVNTTNGFSMGERHTLFNVAAYGRHPSHRAYAVMPDNQHFLMIRRGAAANGDLVMVDNWFTELSATVRAKR